MRLVKESIRETVNFTRGKTPEESMRVGTKLGYKVGDIVSYDKKKWEIVNVNAQADVIKLSLYNEKNDKTDRWFSINVNAETLDKWNKWGL